MTTLPFEGDCMADNGRLAHSSMDETLARQIAIGLLFWRCLISYSRWMPREDSTRAATPYSVSVGMATTPSALRISQALWRISTDSYRKDNVCGMDCLYTCSYTYVVLGNSTNAQGEASVLPYMEYLWFYDQWWTIGWFLDWILLKPHKPMTSKWSGESSWLRSELSAAPHLSVTVAHSASTLWTHQIVLPPSQWADYPHHKHSHASTKKGLHTASSVSHQH